MPNEDFKEMTPMEAWRVVSANLMELYKRRNAMGFKPYVDTEIQAEVICYMALKDMEERLKKEKSDE